MQFNHKKILTLYIFCNLWYYFYMDEITRRKLRAVGAIAVLVAAACSIFFVFYQIKEKKNTTLRLRAFYSDMVQTLQLSMNMNFTPDIWEFKRGYRNVDIINNYIAQYMQVQKNCVSVPGDCFPETNYKNFTDKPTDVNLSKIPSFVLKNGISLAFETISSCKKRNAVCAIVYVDMNSVDEPNTFGKDLFVFMLVNSKQRPFLPYNINVSKEKLMGDPKIGCNKEAEMPMYCSAYLYDNDWIMDKSYPW